MGKITKKKGTTVSLKRRNTEEPAKKNLSTKKTKLKEEEKDEIDLEDDEHVSNEESEDDEEDSEIDEEQVDFDFEAFPMEEGDRDGIVNILTQIFLRAEVDTKGLADAIIAQSPFGSVIGPADDEADEDDPNVVHGLFTILPFNSQKTVPKYEKDVTDYLLAKARKYASKEVVRRLEEVLQTPKGGTGLFINERLLNFPSQVVPPAFRSLRTDFTGMKKQPKNIIYIQKIRISEKDEKGKEEEDDDGEDGAPSTSKEKPKKKKKKVGKAEKKRLAAAAVAQADIVYDNEEDATLLEISKGEEVHFDYPVHMDVEPGSKFHVVEKDGKKLMPFRRVAIIDSERLDVFLKSDGQ